MYSKIVEALLVGAFDTHQHLGPSVIPRKLDVIEGLKEAQEAGMGGIVIKDHQFPTAAQVELAEKYYGIGSTRIFSGIALNNEVGGLNVYALETAINMGIKVVWMPTISTVNHHVKHETMGLAFPASKKKTSIYKHPQLELVDENGCLIKAAKDVLNVIAQNPEIVLCTGHGNHIEVNSMICEANKLGIKNIMVNHPTYMIDASLEEMKQWIDMGAYMEIGAGTSDPDSPYCNHPIEDTVELIHALGADHIVIGSDYGQMATPKPIDGLKKFYTLLLQNGVSAEEIEKMVKDNPRKVLGVDN